jgi:hypothetical protein
VSVDRLVWEFDIQEKQGVNRVENLEVPKSRVNLDRSLKGTCVKRSSCSGVQRSRELECANVNSFEA